MAKLFPAPELPPWEVAAALCSVEIFQCDVHVCGRKNRGENSDGVWIRGSHTCPEVSPALRAEL